MSNSPRHSAVRKSGRIEGQSHATERCWFALAHFFLRNFAGAASPGS